MCIIGEGEIGTLLKGGLVQLSNGDVYPLKDCQLKPGGRLSLSVGSAPPAKIWKPQPKIKGVSILPSEMIGLGSGNLEVQPIALKTMTSAPEPLPPPEVPMSPFAVVGGVLLLVLKKVAGLDRQLKSGNCQLRHQEAITRIAKLEGKVLRKQIVDGAKFVKGKIDERKEKEGKS
jgi:hypothetical protein